MDDKIPSKRPITSSTRRNPHLKKPDPDYALRSLLRMRRSRSSFLLRSDSLPHSHSEVFPSPFFEVEKPVRAPKRLRSGRARFASKI
jgi:hypothetical protein